MAATIGNYIRKTRREKQVTQEDLAVAVGVTRQTIIALEKGNYIPSLLLALRLASFFQKPVDALFYVQGTKGPE